jgi:type I restriction enzyme S subunit
VRVGYRFDVQLGKMLDAARIDVEDTLPYLRNANVYWDRFDLADLKEMTFTADDRRLYRVVPGDLLVCEGRHVGRSAVWSGELPEIYFQKALHRVRPLAKDSARLLMWCLRLMHDRGDFYADGTGSTIPHLPAERLRAARIPWPPLDEQPALLARIDGSARGGRELEEEARSIDAALQIYRDALITEAVTGQLDVARVSDAQMDESLHAAAESEAREVFAR